MNISGFLMVYFMRSTQRSKSSMSSKLAKAQNEWLKFMPRKLLMSILLTPLTDRILYAVFAVNIAKIKPVVEEPEYEADDIYDFSNQEDGDIWGENDPTPKSRGSMTMQQKKDSVDQLIVMFKLCMVFVLYIYSTYNMKYRTENGNFDDQ